MTKGKHPFRVIILLGTISYLIVSCTASDSNPTTIAFSSPPLINSTQTTSPSMLRTSTPSESPTATPTLPSWATPYPQEAIFVQYGLFGGDGGNSYDFYYGRSTPELIIYSNGIAIRRVDIIGSNAFRFETSQLSEAELCHLQKNIAGPALPEVDPLELTYNSHPYFNFDDDATFFDGGPVEIYQLNGSTPRYIQVEIGHYKYLIPEAKKIVDYIESYSLPNANTYEPNTLLLWIEKGRGSADENETPTQWPETLPSLGFLFTKRIEGQGYLNSSHVILEGSLAQKVRSAFNDEMKEVLFRENGELYYTILRPLLPHESPEGFSIFPSIMEGYEVPFNCSD